MSLDRFHKYHLVTASPWPLLISLAVFITVIGTTMYMHCVKHGLFLLFFGLANTILIMSIWWRDVIREATIDNKHTFEVQTGLRIGFILFIVSEIMFFFGFFWSFFHSALSPSIILGGFWPPLGIIPFNPLSIPLVNTCLLLLSGATITYTHHNLMQNNYYPILIGFYHTLLCAITFTALQLEEYLTAPFTLSDSVFGSVFYMITGLHGTHVIIGTIFIFVCYIRFEKAQFKSNQHLGFEFSAWYWHFVDAVWLFVYVFIYCWGGLQ